MESHEFDELLSTARQVGAILQTVFSDVTDEELTVESALRHYPLLVLGAAAGAGAVAGWWVGHKRRPALPPPAPPKEPLDYVERLLPESLGKLWKAVPDSVTEEAGTAARQWVQTVLEPMVKQRIDTAASNAAESKWGAFLKGAMERFERSEDVSLDDPEEA